MKLQTKYIFKMYNNTYSYYNVVFLNNLHGLYLNKYMVNQV